MVPLVASSPLTMGAGQSVKLKIGEEIGRGVYGTVHKGTYRGKPVAIKRIHQLLLENAKYNRSDYDHVQQEFVRECDLLASLEHPHVVKFIGVFDVKGDKALVMELLHETLKDYLSRKKDVGMEVVKACRITFQIVEGLKYLHGHNPPLVHRHLNGKNVLLTETGLVKISDLGQAKFRPSDLGYLTTKAPGCLPYMPPEVLGKDPQYTEKVDMFSLGVLMLQIVTRLDPALAPDLQGIGVVAEVERRRDHLKMVDGTHPLRIPIVACLENDPKKRPSAYSGVFPRLNFDNLRRVEDVKPLDTFEVYFNIVIRGAPGSGKSSYLEKYISDQDCIVDGKVLSYPKEKPYTKYFEIDQLRIKADMWIDPYMPLNNFIDMHPSAFKHIHGCLLVIDVTKKSSLSEAYEFLGAISEVQSRETPFILVGTKCDLEEEREVSLADMEDEVIGPNLQGCIEVSSKTGYNVEKPIDLLINHMLACHIKQRKYWNKGEDVSRIR